MKKLSDVAIVRDCIQRISIFVDTHYERSEPKFVQKIHKHILNN